MQARIEKKCFWKHGTSSDLIPLLHHVHFGHCCPVYSTRWVNSVYFLDPDGQDIRLHQEGLRHRIKVRLRWYGAWLGSDLAAQWEIKEKLGSAGRKHRFTLPPLGYENQQHTSDFIHQADKFLASANPSFFELRAQRRPLLGVRYLRHYWQWPGLAVHFTLDEHMQSASIAQLESGIGFSLWDIQVPLLEMKYAPDMEFQIQSLTQNWPIRWEKFSKLLFAAQMLSNA